MLGPVFDLNVDTPLIQMAGAVPTFGQAPLVMGGVQAEGYIYVERKHWLSVWGHADVVEASVTEPNSESGNV